jgi:hypothetical protein
MDWTQVLTLIGVNIALISSVITVNVWVVSILSAQMNSLGGRLDGHAQRIDQLYHMFVDLLKEGKK